MPVRYAPCCTPRTLRSDCCSVHRKSLRHASMNPPRRTQPTPHCDCATISLLHNDVVWWHAACSIPGTSREVKVRPEGHKSWFGWQSASRIADGKDLNDRVLASLRTLQEGPAVMGMTKSAKARPPVLRPVLNGHSRTLAWCSAQSSASASSRRHHRAPLVCMLTCVGFDNGRALNRLVAQLADKVYADVPHDGKTQTSPSKVHAKPKPPKHKILAVNTRSAKQVLVAGGCLVKSIRASFPTPAAFLGCYCCRCVCLCDHVSLSVHVYCRSVLCCSCFIL